MDENFYKTRYVGLGNIGPDIKFGGFSLRIKKVVTLAYFVKSGTFWNFKNLSDGNFYKTRFVGIGLICPNIQFGGLMFKNKKVVTVCAKNGGSVVAVHNAKLLGWKFL